MSDALSRLARGAEKATDEFVLAVDARTEVEATYLRKFHGEYAACEENVHAARQRFAEANALEERIALNAAEGALERAKAVLRTRLAILSAAQTHFRAVDHQISAPASAGPPVVAPVDADGQSGDKPPGSLPLAGAESRKPVRRAGGKL